MCISKLHIVNCMKYALLMKEHCQSCETSSNVKVNAKLYKKELFIMETFIVEFHQNLYIPLIQNLAL